MGNTHRIAEAIAEGLRSRMDADVSAHHDAHHLDGVDLLVVGGPTHMHGMARSATKRQGAEHEQASGRSGEPTHEIDDEAYGESLRHWFHHLPKGAAGPAAAFDTRFDGAPSLTGRASNGIGRRLRHHGLTLVVEPESFLVDQHNELVDGELDRAHAWGERLAGAVGDGGG
jgi:hypothetical protein